MRVFVAGATGAVGRPLVPGLLAAGHQVTATTRSAAKAGELRAMGAEAIVADGLDARGMTEAVVRAEPDAIVHQMTALAGTPDLRRFDRWFAATNELRTKGTDILMAAARRVGVGRLVAQSYTGWTNPTTGGPVKSERDGFEPDPPKMQRRSLAAIRYVEETVPAALSHGIVLRYGNFYGPGASESLVELVRKRRFPLIADGAGVWSWIHLDDAAAATIAALERGGRGVYNITDDEPARVSEWLAYLAEMVGAKPPMRVPVPLARMMAGSVAVRWMTEGRGSSNEKAKLDLGWQPAWRTWRDGFRDGLDEPERSGAISRVSPQGGDPGDEVAKDRTERRRILEPWQVTDTIHEHELGARQRGQHAVERRARPWIV
jgi:nucleoside-diphosphate-sugar epimerase